MNDNEVKSGDKTFKWQGQNIVTDKEGFLKSQYQWTEELANELGRREGVELTDQHWTLMNYLREYYEDYDIAPPMRVMVKVMVKEYGKDSISSRVLHELFPNGPAKQGSRFAGLPKPKNCL